MSGSFLDADSIFGFSCRPMGLFTQAKNRLGSWILGEVLKELGEAELEPGSGCSLALRIRRRGGASPHLQMKFSGGARSSSYEITRFRDGATYFERAAAQLRDVPTRTFSSPASTPPSSGLLDNALSRLSQSIMGEILVDLGELEFDDHGRKLSLSVRRFPGKAPFLSLRITGLGDSVALQTTCFVECAELFHRAAAEMRTRNPAS
jgi:hypothetical protein